MVLIILFLWTIDEFERKECLKNPPRAVKMVHAVRFEKDQTKRNPTPASGWWTPLNYSSGPAKLKSPVGKHGAIATPAADILRRFTRTVDKLEATDFSQLCHENLNRRPSIENTLVSTHDNRSVSKIATTVTTANVGIFHTTQRSATEYDAFRPSPSREVRVAQHPVLFNFKGVAFCWGIRGLLTSPNDATKDFLA